MTIALEMIPSLESERLIFTPFSEADAAALHRLWTAAPVREHLWDGEKIDLSQARATVRQAVSDADRTGIGMWTLRLKSDAALAGFCGFRWFGIPPQVELLYGLRPDLWGKGLASEAARSCIHWLFDTHPVRRVLAGTDPGNTRSLKLLERLGFQPIDETMPGLEHLRYFALARSAQFTPPERTTNK